MIEITSQVTLSACLLIIGLLGSLTATTPTKHKLDEFFAYSQCIYDNQTQVLITTRALKQDGFKLGTSSFDSQFTSDKPTPSNCHNS